MELIRSRQELSLLDRQRRGDQLVLVPTMGALHAGHLSLVESARHLGSVVVSVFVNPTQFGVGEDFDAYPQDLEDDLQALAPYEVEAVFAPDVNQMYPGGAGVMVRPGPRAAPLCGARRPEHFAGVLTVVAKLFHLIQPDVAVFGRKDAQQCLVIDEMVRDLDFAVRLIDAPTVRESDGLAMSSRNRYLSPEQRQRALCLWQGLARGRELLVQGERDSARIHGEVVAALKPADAVEYVEIRSVPELESLVQARGRLVLAVAARVGPARLIDNLVLEIDGAEVHEVALLDGGR